MSFTTVTESMIEVMQAYVSGQPIEYRRLGEKVWVECSSPVWDWVHNSYRAKPLTPDYIDWAQVSDKYKYMARDSSGDAYLYLYEPELVNNCYWFCEDDNPVKADVFASYKKGDVSWDNSLVERP